MNPLRKLFPTGASTMAGEVDSLFYFLCAVSFTVALVLAVMIIFFAVRYRARAGSDLLGAKREPMRAAGVDEADVKRMEYAWIGGPLIVFLVIFYWGAKLFAAMASPPPDAMQVYIVGKQWMWKVEHPSGKREINELHVPRGQAVKLKMTSEDVIHSFSIPAFRIKQDAVPGMHIRAWFQPTETGVYELGCAELCGLGHYKMRAVVTVLSLEEYRRWLGEQSTTVASK